MAAAHLKVGSWRMAHLAFTVVVVATVFVLTPLASATAAPEVDKTVGPNECAECHKLEVEVWKATHHFKTFRELPRQMKAREIAEAMGQKRIKAASVCLNCHFTLQRVDDETKPIAGISCESCHSAGKDWIKVHSNFSGHKKKEQESEAERDIRWENSEAAGMIRPTMIYALAKNCYGCHIVPNEKLVNVGGHAAGSAFELVSWSQGEVRHNVWYSENKENRHASSERKRILYVIGHAIELETALRAVAAATEKKKYAVSMAKRAYNAKLNMEQIAEAVPLPEIQAIVAAANGVKLKLNNQPNLTAAADEISKQTIAFTENYDGTSLAAIDPLIPPEAQYKGIPAR